MAAACTTLSAKILKKSKKEQYEYVIDIFGIGHRLQVWSIAKGSTSPP